MYIHTTYGSCGITGGHAVPKTRRKRRDAHENLLSPRVRTLENSSSGGNSMIYASPGPEGRSF